MFENKYGENALEILAVKFTDKSEAEVRAVSKTSGSSGVLKLISENCTCVTREEMQAAIAKAIAEYAAGNN